MTMKKSKRIKVIYLINGLKPGGGERMLQQLVIGLRHEFDITIYCLTRLGTVADELRSVGTTVTLLRGPLSWKSLWNNLKNADIVHTHFFYSDLLGAILRQAIKVPCLISTRHETGFWMRPWHRWLEQRFYPYFDSILCVSKAVAQSLERRGIHETKLIIIPPGVAVDILFHRQIKTQQPIIVTVGRLETVKGHDVLLHALVEMGRDFKLYLIGDGSQRRALQNLASKLGIKHLCEFVGAQATNVVRRYLQQADLFVLPSRSEGLPLSLLEAMGTELPCIASATGGIGEVISDNINGLLVTPNNIPDLAQAIKMLIDDPKLRQHLGQQARFWVEAHYSSTIFVHNTKLFYEKAVRSKIH